MGRLVQHGFAAADILMAGEGSLEEAGLELGLNRWKEFIEKGKEEGIPDGEK